MLNRTTRLETITGPQLGEYIAELARLRIQVFRAFPYLYDGDLDYEQKYLQTYLKCPDAAVVIAFDGDQVVGASSCLPMRDETPDFQQPFIEHAETLPFTLDSLFYCAESVLDPAYRGTGLGVAFFEKREQHARELGGFTHACFCAVDRPADHPLRPVGYQPLDSFWRNRGYEKSTLTTEVEWKDIDQTASTLKTMTFWFKELAHT